MINKLKIGINLSHALTPDSGGSYTYFSKIIDLIDNYQFDERLEFVFFSTIDKEWPDLNKELLVIKPQIHFTLKENILKSLTRLLVFFSKRIFKKANEYLNNLYKRKKDIYIKNELIKNGIEICYNIYPYDRNILIPFVSTHWDIGHRSTFAFPEMMEKEEYEIREEYYNNFINRSLAVFVESQAGKKELIHYTSINEEKIFVIPLFPGDVVNQSSSLLEEIQALTMLDIESKHYFIYPAQFWAHKNHILLIDALEIVLQTHPKIKVIFCGADKGNLQHVISYISKKQLTENIIITGFVTNKELYIYYKNALALVMPTFLGPTNIPLLEAANIGCPAIVSDIPGHREQLGNYGTYFNPLDKMDLATKLLANINQTDTPAPYQNTNTYLHTLRALEDAFIKIYPVRKSWK